MIRFFFFLLCQADNGPLEKRALLFSRLGLGEAIAASAIHALGEVTILETIAEKLAGLGMEEAWWWSALLVTFFYRW
jgi:hypothetical protein